MSINSIQNPSLKLTIPDGKEARISLFAREVKPAFLMVGNGRYNRKLLKGTPVMDLITEMAHMTPQELFVVELLRNNLISEKRPSATSEIVVVVLNEASTVGLLSSSADKQKFKKGFSRLFEKDIVRKVKRQRYMFNPSFIIPQLYEESLAIWNSTASKSDEV